MIRPVERKDIRRLVELCSAHAKFEGSSYFPMYKAQDLATHLLGPSPTLQCQVVEWGNTLHGYVSYMKQFSTWDASFYVYMDCLYLEESARNKGIGKELMKKVEAYARKEQCDHIQWQTPKENSNAVKFYQSLGAESKEKERFFLHLTV